MVSEDFSEGFREPVSSRLIKLLHQNHFFPLLVASVTAMGFYFAERWTSEWRGPRLHLNLFLAWVPYFLGILMMLSATFPGTKLVSMVRILLILAWFFFFPNAPYLITDFAYLEWDHYDLWQRVAIFCIFSQCGFDVGDGVVVDCRETDHSLVWCCFRKGGGRNRDPLCRFLACS